MKINWTSWGFAGLSFSLGALLFFYKKSTYEGFELMTEMTVACLCWPAMRALFNWRLLLLSLVIITPASLCFQWLAVKNQIWVYGNTPYLFGQIHWGSWKMPLMEVLFYFLFPRFQISLFSFCYRHFPPKTRLGKWSWLHLGLLFLAPLLFFSQAFYLQFQPWQTGPRPIDWNCAIMGTAFSVTIITYALSKNYRGFVRTPFFGIWTLVMAAYIFLWEQFHAVLYDHWRYVLNHCLFPPWIIVDPEKNLGLSQAQIYGYFMTATVFPAIIFLVAELWKKAIQPDFFIRSENLE